MNSDLAWKAGVADEDPQPRVIGHLSIELRTDGSHILSYSAASSAEFEILADWASRWLRRDGAGDTQARVEAVG